jgi:subtilisin family serine protease
VIIAALERAYSDGMDVVNLSLGGGSSWADTSLSKVAGSLANLGVVVVAAIGNDGELGIDEVSSPSINRDAISVTSFEGSGYLSNYFLVKGASETRIGIAIWLNFHNDQIIISTFLIEGKED